MFIKCSKEDKFERYRMLVDGKTQCCIDVKSLQIRVQIFRCNYYILKTYINVRQEHITVCFNMFIAALLIILRY